MNKSYDAIVIGAGQSGPPLAERISAAGMSVAVVERHLVGGTCVNVGCIPTKTLVGSARIAHYARTAAHFGVDISGSIEVDMQRVKARKDEIAGASHQGVSAWIDNMDNAELIRGHARFVAPRAVEVNGDTLAAERIFIDVGARARVPDWPGIDDVPYLTNSSMMEVDFLPRHLIIVGGSYIGLEFAQMYRRFGSEVTVVEMAPRLIPRDDEDVSAALQEILADEGIRFRLKASCLGLSIHEEGVAVRVSCAEGSPDEIGSHVLLAIGRVPNTDDLGLDAAGIETDARGFIKVDEHLATNVAGVWALGEVNGRGAFTHTSYNDFEIAAANLFDDDPRGVSDRILCYGLFTDHRSDAQA